MPHPPRLRPPEGLLSVIAWTRPTLEPVPRAPGWELVAPARVATRELRVLYVGGDEEALDAAAKAAVAADDPEALVLAPPETPWLPIAVHRLTPPKLEGRRVLFLPRIDEAVVPGPLSLASPVYLLPMLERAAGAPLSIVATALEAHASEWMAQRGLWSRFEVRRVKDGGANTSPPHQADPWARCERALRSQPESALALVVAASRKPPAEAAALLKRAVAQEPELPAAHYELGKALVQTDDLSGAVEAFRTTTELLPAFGSAWGNLGAALGEARKLEESIAALTRAVELDPLNHALHSSLGVALRDQGRLDEAEARLREALALATEFVFGHYNLGSVLYLAGRYPDAIAAFERGRELDASRSPRQSLLLAAARLAAGDTVSALEEYRRVFERLDDERMKQDLRRVAEWDLKELEARMGSSESIREAARLLESLA